MSAEIRMAILPIALRNGRGQGDLDRTALLIESLARHWTDRRPLQLLIVSAQRDLETVGLGLPAFANTMCRSAAGASSFRGLVDST
jgi:hypothetical protein